jgi:hypothetical protein
MENKHNIIYSVIVNKQKLSCINTKNGSILGSLSFNGEVISGPIVTGDRCVVTFKSSSNKKTGSIYKLPKFSIVSTFNY